MASQKSGFSGMSELLVGRLAVWLFPRSNIPHHIKTVEDAVVFTCMTFAKTFDIRPVTITKTLFVGWCFVQEIIAINNITVILRPTLCHWCNDNILATGTVFGNPQTTTRVTNGDFPSRVKQLIREHDLWRRATPEATTPAFSPWHVFLS